MPVIFWKSTVERYCQKIPRCCLPRAIPLC
nr:MAG TPA_asm: hypothetical protein [Caudoviricetes sp.]DAM40722.1 MAG TPA: hypothetical protein [Caudoviricetes sp.]